MKKEIKRRTRVATLFPNLASCLRLVSAILAEQDEEWMTAKIYLTIKPGRRVFTIYRFVPPGA
jgi:transposase-like protein